MNKKKSIGFTLGEKTQELFEQVVIHMRLKKREAGEKLITDLKQQGIEKEFENFLNNIGTKKNLEPSGKKPTIFQFTQEVREELDNIHWNYGFLTKTIFFKYLIYFYYDKHVGNIKDVFKID